MRVFVDARMLGHSGIGVALESILRVWKATRPFALTLLGAPERLRPWADADTRIVPWTHRIYASPTAALASLRAHGAAPGDAFFSPHYATTLRPGLPSVVFVQDLLHITHPPRTGTAAYLRLWLRLLRASATRVVTPSRHVKVQLQTLHGFDAHRVLTIPLGPGIASGPITPPAAFALPPRYLLAVGLFKPHKNWAFLLDRLSRQPAHRALPLLAAGAFRDADRLRAEAARLGMADRLHIVPHLDDCALRHVIAHAHALLHPALAEGFGLPILEAMALGTPVIACDRAPMNEIAGGAALLFDPDRPDTFDAALASLDDPARRDALTAAGRTNAARYSWETCAQTLADVLVEVARERGS